MYSTLHTTKNCNTYKPVIRIICNVYKISNLGLEIDIIKKISNITIIKAKVAEKLTAEIFDPNGATQTYL